MRQTQRSPEGPRHLHRIPRLSEAPWEVPYTKGHCHPRASSAKTRGFHTQLDEGPAGPKRPHLGVCPGPNIPLQGSQGSRGCIPGSPGAGASQGFPRAAAPVGVFSRGTTRISGSLSCGAREVRSPCVWRGGSGISWQWEVGVAVPALRMRIPAGGLKPVQRPARL